MIQKQEAIEEKTDHFGHIKLKRKNKTKPFARGEKKDHK